MIKGVLFFLALFSVSFLGLRAYLSATNREKLNFWKQVGYASIPAWFATVVVLSIIFFF